MDNSLTSYKIFVIAAFLFFTGSVLGWFIEHPWFSFVVGTLFGIFVVDCAFSLRLGTALRKKAMQIDKASAINIQKMQTVLRQDRVVKFFSAHSERFLTEKLQSFEDFISRSPAKMSASCEDKR